MPSEISLPLLIALASGASWLISFISWLAKGQDWVENVTLRVLKSEEGRRAVMQMNRDHFDGKLDSIVERLNELSGRINHMSNKLERRLDKLDADMQAINVRVTVLEQRENSDKA